MRHKFLFIMDPIHAVQPDQDTTFAFMLASQARGHEIDYCQVADLYVNDCRPAARVHRAHVSRDSPYARLEPATDRMLADYNAIFMRKDPPVDYDYLYATQLLSLLPRPLPLLVNNPQGLRDANEKLYALNFPTLTPTTFVSRDIPRLRSFIHQLGGQAIVKPLDGCGGMGVLLLNESDRNLGALLEISTHSGKTLLLAQRYIPEIRNGHKRILLLNGEPLGAILRVPRPDDNRGNLHVGGTSQPSDLSARDLEIITTLRPHLQRDGLIFTGIDVIGDYLTEVNVTSPTGIQELSMFSNVDHAMTVVDYVEARISEFLPNI